MKDETNSRFDRLLKAMVQGEPPKAKAKQDAPKEPKQAQPKGG